tara:strand:+ start:48 stop:575 length:528 start_codon:yes stop_codon:yes gene_type:complete
MARPWIAFFSQTGSEIVDIIDKLGKYPDQIYTNFRPSDLRQINSKIPYYAELNNKPDLKQLEFICSIFENPIITLHGWLRIMPPEICNKYEIYNGHPGLITKYPELKGKDPQMRAWNGDYKTVGTVIHKVTEGVDEGEIISSATFTKEGLDVDGYFRILREMSSTLWVDFLREKL